MPFLKFPTSVSFTFLHQVINCMDIGVGWHIDGYQAPSSTFTGTTEIS